MSRLAEFLIGLSEKPASLAEFPRQEEVMRLAGLDDEEREALRSKNREKILKLLQGHPHRPPVHCHIIYPPSPPRVTIDVEYS